MTNLLIKLKRIVQRVHEQLAQSNQGGYPVSMQLFCIHVQQIDDGNLYRLIGEMGGDA